MIASASALFVGCGGAGSPSSGSEGKLEVVAAENFWGSIARQLGGDHVQVQSIITNPNADPHTYEPTAADARSMATARLAIVNGIGYDPWAPKLLGASPLPGRIVVTVGELVGIPDGGNPHRWYSPPDVQRVINQITADYQRLDPAHGADFSRQRTQFETTALAPYKRLLAGMKQRYAGVAVGASESIFAPLAQAIGLRLLTPPGFLKAISEGTEPTAGDKATTDRQIAARQIKVWVYNSQNTTPDVQRVTDAAKASQIPVATVTETLTPPTASFQDWQARELRALLAALHEATGK